MKRATRFGILTFLLGALVLLGVSRMQLEAQTPTKPGPTAIQIQMIEGEEIKLPPDFQMALYENLVQEVRRTGKFQQVYRDGDKRAAEVPDLVTLRSTVRGFKEGSARAREVTTVAGATHIKVHVELAGHDGKVLLNRDVEGKVRFFGENLRATYDFAKKVAKLLQQSS
ncbi:MAG TPA: hypothetical protein VKE24_00450 [Candidatus Acidoferrales bacterium]|nr:hypothetical protein [Candidatus Acidoferrales bacterium]